MASPRWDFRRILDVCPDSHLFTCVGTWKDGTRCGNTRPFLANADLSNAASILDRMDRLPSLKNSYKYLVELAELTLCKKWHRHAQTQQVVMRWQAAIKAYAREVQMTENRVALVKVRDELAAMRENTLKFKATVVEDNKENVIPIAIADVATRELVPPPKSVHRFTTPGFVRSNLEDPFSKCTGMNSAKPKLSATNTTDTGAFFANGIDNSTCQHEVSKIELPVASTESVSTSAGTPPPIRKLDVVTSRFSTNKSTSRRLTYIVKENDSPTIPPQDILLPSPPITPLSSRSVEGKVNDVKGQNPPIIPLTRADTGRVIGSHKSNTDVQRSKTVASKRTSFALEFGSQSSVSMNKFIFELPAEVPIKPNPETKSQRLQLDSTSSQSTSQLGLPPSPPIEIPVPVIPRKSSRRQRVPRLNTSLSISKPAPLDITSSVRLSYILTSLTQEADIARRISTRCASTPINHLKEASPYRVSPATPVNRYTGPEVTSASTPSPQCPSPLSPTPPKEARQSFGYAVVTPSPTRYSTYLPARQQHGLATPPDTPENLPPPPTRQAPGVPPLTLAKDEDYFTAVASPRSRFNIPRKPLPPRSSTSLRRRDEVRWRSTDRVRMCQVCRMPQYVNSRDGKRCDCLKREEEVVKSGCLDNLGWAGLRQRVIDRMKSKESEGEALEIMSPKKSGRWTIGP